MADDCSAVQTETNTESKTEIMVTEMTPQERYYLIHHNECLARAREKYNQRPDVIARRQERERIRAEKGQKTTAEKEAERAVKRIEKAKKMEEKRIAALNTKRKQSDAKRAE